MLKPKLILNPADQNSLSPDYIQSFLTQWFDLVTYSTDHTYDANDIFVVNAFKAGNPVANYWYLDHLHSNGKVLVDNLWEYEGFYRQHFQHLWETCFIAHAPNWFWFSECLRYSSEGFQRKPQPNYSKLAFMPMRMPRSHRNDLLASLASKIDSMIWSYSSHGRCLPNDLDLADSRFQRWANNSWYDDTCFSMVCETFATTEYPLFVTEKTYKPIALQHPFVIWGQPGHLAELRSQGFATFDNMFDESYDSILDYSSRLAAVTKSVLEYRPQLYSQETNDRIQHNHNHFFNKSVVESAITKALILPLLEYAHTR